ncbi:MAG: DUF2723 domain-containing protein [Gemmatimonadales bacterium]
MTTVPLPGARMRVAAAVFAAVFAGYLLTLAPTVTLWDSGEFLAAAKGLGIPHPPGTPLFVLLAHVWAALIPWGTFAWRVNLLSAVGGAATAALFALPVHEALRRDALLGNGRGAEAGAALAALVGAFTFTQWQNSNETEIYAVATAMIGVMAWLTFRWRELRGEAHAPRTLLLIVYLLALTVGNHLLALLAGPAVIAFLAATLHAAPSAESGGEWAEVGVVAGIWALLVGIGLGSVVLGTVGAVGFVAAAAFAWRQRREEFALVALLLAVLGVSTYLFLLIRSGQHPVLNEAEPDSWGRLFGVIGRTQYPVRTPFDDPTVLHGATNPGRSLAVIGLQLTNYAQYFIWQWGIARAEWLRAVVAVMFASLGAFGARAHWRSDRAGWWFFATLWLVTGLGLVAYMNFKPGFSQLSARFPDAVDHEVRERDYFFVVSFVVWGLWAGMQLARLAARAFAERAPWRRALGACAGAATLVPLILNWPIATRRGPDRTLASDVAYDLLNSVPPYGILVTYGDNDTFPLWYLQEVEGVRQDVTVVCLALANTDWYVRQLRDLPVRPFDEAAAPPIWRGLHPARPDRPLHAMSDGEIARIAGQLTAVDHDDTLQLGPVTEILHRGTELYPNQYVLLRILQQNLGRRPFAWAVTTGRDFLGLDQHVVLQGLAYRLQPAAPDTSDPRYGGRRIAGTLVDVPLTEQLVWQTYRYGDLVRTGIEGLDPAAEGLAINLGLPFTYLASIAQLRGDLAGAIRNLTVATRLAPSPQLSSILASLNRGAPAIDSSHARSR